MIRRDGKLSHIVVCTASAVIHFKTAGDYDHGEYELGSCLVRCLRCSALRSSCLLWLLV
jgi:hypothetical protein